MRTTLTNTLRATALAALTCLFSWQSASAATLIDLQMNEGSGITTTDSAVGVVGKFGYFGDPATDIVLLSDASPTGATGDRSIRAQGNGFLLADDSAQKVLAFSTNEAFTIETWLNITAGAGRLNEGIVTYGSSYKVGLKAGETVFTLLGAIDITNSGAYPPVEEWSHIAVVWQPGLGVTFYQNGVSNFVARTNAMLPYRDNYLVIGAEIMTNSLNASFDRLRIHRGALTQEELDNVASVPKPAYTNTVVNYLFDETDLPVKSSLQPELPSINSIDIVSILTGPAWTNDAPSGLASDHALAFNLNEPAVRQRVNFDRDFNLGVNATNYTLQAWVKLPSQISATRMVMFRTAGTGPRVSFSITQTRALHTTVYGVQDLTSSVIVPDDNNWHHVAVVMNNYAQVQFYLDGVLRQTMNRTDARNASSSGVGNLQLGLESAATTYFKGMIDRIRIHDTALANAQLDAAKIAGAPFIAAQPTNLTVTIGVNASFSAIAGGDATLSYQWRYAPANDPTNKSNVAGGNAATLDLGGAQLSQDGFYSVVVSNGNGSVESAQARLTVTTTPIISVQPTNVTTVVTSEAAFSVTASPAAGYGPLSYQWRYAPPANPTNYSIIAGANSSTYTLSNLQLTNQGFYSVLVSNDGGSTESIGARLIATAPGTLQPLWSIKPTDGRAYITGYNTNANLRDLERGMAYNPTTDHVLIAARFTSPLAKGIFIVDAATGAHVGELKSVTNIISGGTIVLTRVVVAEDGAIYACNFGTLSDAVPLKIYRWANETAEPTIAYQGNPVSGIAANQSWGKNMTVRGSGTNTQILMDTRNVMHALFTTTDGSTFTPTIILPDAAADESGLGLQWGTNGIFWSKSSGRPLYQWQVNLPSTNAPLVRSFAGSGFPSSGFQNFSFSEDNRFMAGLLIQSGADAVELYDVSDLARGPLLVDAGVFGVDNPHTVNYGNVVITKNRVIALNPNNGIAAFSLPSQNPIVGVRKTGSDLIVFWPASATGYVLEASTSLTTPAWNTVSHVTVGDENQATITTSGSSTFYRLKK